MISSAWATDFSAILTFPTKGNVIVPLPPGLNVTQVNLALINPVSFVSNKEEREPFWVFRPGLVLEVTLPLGNTFEALGTCNVVNKHTCLSTTVKGDSQTLVTFLTCCVPYLNRLIR